MHDVWRSGYLRRSLSEIALGETIHGANVVWLPDAGPLRYLADPFAIEKDGVLTVFVEAYDHRTRHGVIRYFQYDASDRLVGDGLALSEPWHLSYPQLIEEDGLLYMAPEGHKSGACTLYRCDRFPDRWTAVTRVIDRPVIDATLLRHDGRWWMFHALPGPQDKAMQELHVSYAPTLTGPWTPHPLNPVMRGFQGSRPGGTALSMGDAVMLPVQDCRASYGAAIDWLRIERLNPTQFDAALVSRVQADGLLAGFDDGLHTLSGGETFTCLDVKSLRRSRREGLVGVEFKLRRLFGLGTTQRRARPKRPGPLSAGPLKRARS